MRNVVALAVLAASLFASPALAQSIPIDATANIYQPAGATGDGSAPVTLSTNGASAYTFSVSGTTTFNGGSNSENPDGAGSAQGMQNFGYGSFSGVTAPTSGFLAGVFTTDAPTGTAPASLSYSGLTIGDPSYSPLLNQVFFIGDGLTGDGTGLSQVFNAPAGATKLVLGFADACSYYGGPGCYGDNSGTLNVTANAIQPTGAVPEPATWAMMLLGFGAIGVATRRKRTPALVRG